MFCFRCAQSYGSVSGGNGKRAHCAGDAAIFHRLKQLVAERPLSVWAKIRSAAPVLKSVLTVRKDKRGMAARVCADHPGAQLQLD